jgi:ACS family hexuronate transporter-like MFS transporter
MKIPHLRWYIAILLFTATVINYIDRQTLSIVAPVVTKELHISPVAYSNILQTFLVAYTVMYLGSGFLVDKLGTRLSLACFMGWWSVSNILHAFANTAMQFGVYRFLLGVGEPGNFMAAFKAISEWYPAKEKAFVNGLVNAGAAAGAIIAAPLVAWLMVRFGWRSSFVVTGVMGFVWMAAWLLLYRLPENHRFITSAELLLIREAKGDGTSERAPKLRTSGLLRFPQTWGLFLARFISDPVWWFYLFWLPKYLVEDRGFTLVQMGMLAWLPYLFADAGSIVGGLASGCLMKRSWTVLKAREAVMLPSALIMPLSVIIAFTPSSFLAMAVICLVVFAHMAWKTNLMTITNDIYPVGAVGSISGMIAFGSGLGGALFTNVTGRVVEHFSYRWMFIVMGFMHPAAYLIFRLLVRKPIADEPEHLATDHLRATALSHHQCHE